MAMILEEMMKQSSYERNRVTIRIWTTNRKEGDLDIGHVSIETPNNPLIILWCRSQGDIKDFYESKRFANFFDEKKLDFVISLGQDRIFAGRREPDKVFCLYTLSYQRIFDEFDALRFKPRTCWSPYVRNVLLSDGYPGSCARTTFDLLSKGGLERNSSSPISLITFLTNAKRAELIEHPATTRIFVKGETDLPQDVNNCIIL